MPMERAAGDGRECWQCRGALTAPLVCARCEAVQPLSPETDLFAVLGLPRHPAVDVAELERRYHEASRAVHPDRFQTAHERARALSLAASAAVNRAYRTLRDPVSRGRYWLELRGERLAAGGAQVPPAIAAEVFETQEKLEELRAAAGAAEAESLRREVVALRARLAERLAGLQEGLVELYARWNGDERGALRDLRRRLAEIAYLGTLFGDIDEAVGEGLRGTHHRH
jgi:molecular chaperone HscB